MKKFEKGFRLLFLFLLVGCIFIHIAAYALLNVHGFSLYCNSDVYADTQVAMRMWEQKTLFPQDWVFGNQFYVVATPVLAALLYGITGSINTAMVLATEVMTVLIFLSFLYLLRGICRDFLAQLMSCLLLIASVISKWGPYSTNSMLFFTQASFYSCYLITMFVVFGDYIRSTQSADRRYGQWLLSLILCFATGMQSLRQTVVMVLPILACEIYRMLRRLMCRIPVLEKGSQPALIRAITYLLSNLAGIVAIKGMQVSNASIYGQMELTGMEQLSDKLRVIGTALLEITSLDALVPEEFPGPVMAAGILFMVCLAAIGAILWLIRIRRPETPAELCWLLFAVGIAGVLLSTVVLNITLRAIYIFMWFPLVAISGILLWQKLPQILKYALILACCAVSLPLLKDTYSYYIDDAAQTESTSASELCQWAIENGYSYIYGEYWSTAPSVACYSDGMLEAGCWHKAENVFAVEPSNTPRDIYDAQCNARAIYVFTDEDEAQGIRKALERNAVLEKVAQFGDYRAYTASVPLMTGGDS